MPPSSEADPMEGIRDVFEAYKLLMMTTSKPNLSFVVKHLAKVFNGESERPSREGCESKDLTKLRIVFQAYSKLVKWAPEDAAKILTDHLETVVGLKEPAQESLGSVQVKEEIVDDGIEIVSIFEKLPKVAPAVATTSEMTPTPSSSRPLTFTEQGKEVSSSSQNQGDKLKSTSTYRLTAVSSGQTSRSFVQGKLRNLKSLNSLRTSKVKKALKTHNNIYLKNRIKSSVKQTTGQKSSSALSPRGSVESNNGPPATSSHKINDRVNAASTSKASSNNAYDKSFSEIWQSVKDRIRKETEATLQKSGSPYSMISSGSNFLCHVCKERTFSCLTHLAAHIWSEHTKEVPVLNCPHPGCDRTYKHPASYTRHVKKCRHGSAMPDHVKPVARKPTVGNKSKVPKPKAGKLENRHKGTLKKKIGQRQKVGMKESLICSHCDKVYPSQSLLKAHIAYYSTPKSFDCKYCDKSFSHQSGLANHERIHTGEKPYECPYCQKVFNQASHLRTHEQIHFSTKHECKVCHKKYAQKGNLRAHQRISGCIKGLPGLFKS